MYKKFQIKLEIRNWCTVIKNYTMFHISPILYLLPIPKSCKIYISQLSRYHTIFYKIWDITGVNSKELHRYISEISLSVYSVSLPKVIIQWNICKCDFTYVSPFPALLMRLVINLSILMTVKFSGHPEESLDCVVNIAKDIVCFPSDNKIR